MVRIAALYKFTALEDPAALRGPLARLACSKGVRGTVLLAPEGINGTIAGDAEGMGAVIDHIRGLPGCANIDVKMSTADEMPFGRLKVRLKREIVTMGKPGVDPTAAVGTYVDPSDWNELISAPDVVTIDTRNAYETQIGTFSGAIDPKTESFSEFPAWWEANRERFDGKRIAMFCTGGIRCEKATNYLLSRGERGVFHLKGGILKYLEEVPGEESTWQGECFVFDERVSVGHGLKVGSHALCRGCRRPLTEQDRRHPGFEEGVSCHHCVDQTTEAQKARYRERQRQVERATARGEAHLGTE